MEDYTSQVRLEINRILEQIFSSRNTKCTSPNCLYENNAYNNYCVKCGCLLPGHSEKVVINNSEYEELKKKANMSAWDKIKENFSK